MRRSTLSTLLTTEFVKQNWLKFIPQTTPDTHYSLKYLIPHFFAGTYHDQRVAISVLCGANQFEPQIGPWGGYATLYKRFIVVHFCFVFVIVVVLLGFERCLLLVVWDAPKSSNGQLFNLCRNKFYVISSCRNKYHFHFFQP